MWTLRSEQLSLRGNAEAEIKLPGGGTRAPWDGEELV